MPGLTAEMLAAIALSWNKNVAPVYRAERLKKQRRRQRLILMLFAVLGLSLLGFVMSAAAQQCEPGSVCVRQTTIDAATKAATELISARDVISRFAVERIATQAERESAARLIDRLNAVISVQDRLNLEYNAVIALYKSVVQMQSDLIEKLTKQINAPKSAWQKVVAALKTVANIALGIVIGRAGI